MKESLDRGTVDPLGEGLKGKIFRKKEFKSPLICTIF